MPCNAVLHVYITNIDLTKTVVISTYSGKKKEVRSLPNIQNDSVQHHKDYTTLSLLQDKLLYLGIHI